MLLATCDVNTIADSGGSGNQGSLRHCMSPSFDTISFSITAGTIQLQSALPIINWTLTIDGPALDLEGNPVVTVQRQSTAPAFRIFEVASSVTATIRELQMSGGVHAQFGGGIYNAGNLTLLNSVVSGNAVTSTSAQTLRHGGGVYNSANATLRVENSTVDSNTIYGDFTGSGRMQGGGIFNSVGADLEIDSSTFSSNTICLPSCTRTGLPTQDTWVQGGALHNELGTVSIITTSVKNNTIQAADPGHAQFRGEGAGINSRCQYDDLLCLKISYSTISGNEILIAGSVQDGPDTSRATGGGLSLHEDLEGGDDNPTNPEVIIFNTTIANNKITGTTGGAGCTVGAPPQFRVAGAGLWFKWLFVQFEYSTITGNNAANSIDNVNGGGIHVEEAGDSKLAFKATIIANNIDNSPTEDDTKNIFAMASSSLASQGHNLFDDHPKNLILAAGDREDKKVCFAPLNNYGGTTETMRPLPCSDTTIEARNNGPATGLTNDQRELTRPVGARTDIGAVECQNLTCGPGSGPSEIPPPPPGNGLDASWATPDGGASSPTTSLFGNVLPSSVVIFDGEMIQTVDLFDRVYGRVLHRPSVDTAFPLWTDPLQFVTP